MIEVSRQENDNQQIYCLEDRVQDVIDHNPYLSRRKLRCETDKGHVVLRGTVRSYFQKQMAQESVRKIDGIVSIENNLVVEMPVGST